MIGRNAPIMPRSYIMDLLRAIEEKKRLSEFLHFNNFYHTRYFRVGGDTKNVRDREAAEGKSYEELNGMMSRLLRKFEDDTVYDESKKSFDVIFDLKNKNLISATATARRRGANVKEVPLTRGFVKGLEIYTFLRDRLRILRHDSIRAFHLAELPAGFFFALRYFGNLHGIAVENSLHSLKYDPDHYPHAFKDMFGLEEKGVIDYGAAYGDLSDPNEVKYFREKYRGLDLVTADFGFTKRADEGTSPEALQIFYNEANIAASILSNRGVFIFKTYFQFTPDTLRLFYHLYKRFQHMHFYKPLFSRIHSFEIYIICHRPIRKSTPPRELLSFDDFTAHCFPYFYGSFVKIYSIYALFEYLRDYRPDDADKRAIQKIKRILEYVIGNMLVESNEVVKK